jgi:hypothetical protein
MRHLPSPNPRRRENSIAVDWRDCAWAPPIIVRGTVEAKMSTGERALVRFLIVRQSGVKSLCEKHRSSAGDEVTSLNCHQNPPICSGKQASSRRLLQNFTQALDAALHAGSLSTPLNSIIPPGYSPKSHFPHRNRLYLKFHENHD